jgi:hypothetical protein
MRSGLNKVIFFMILSVLFFRANSQIGFQKKKYFFENLSDKGCNFLYMQQSGDKCEKISSSLKKENLELEIGYTCQLFTPILFTSELIQVYGEKDISYFVKGLKLKNKEDKKASLEDLYNDNVLLKYASGESLEDLRAQSDLTSLISRGNETDYFGMIKWLVLTWIYEDITQTSFIESLNTSFPEFTFVESKVSGLEKIKINVEQINELNALLLREVPEIYTNITVNGKNLKIQLFKNDTCIFSYGEIGTEQFCFYINSLKKLDCSIEFLYLDVSSNINRNDSSYYFGFLGEYEDEYFNKTTIFKEDDQLYIHQNGQQKELIIINNECAIIKEDFTLVSWIFKEQEINLWINNSFVGKKDI